MPRVLAVEDDSDLRFLYEAMLARHGFEVVTVASTTTAILTLTNEMFDLIILDMNMPGTPGTKVIEFVRDDARLKDIPILVISASETWRRQVYDLGVEHFFVKPVPLEQLAAIVERVLKK